METRKISMQTVSLKKSRMPNKKPLTALPEWHALTNHADAMQNVHMRDLFAADAQRFDDLHIDCNGLLFDYSKNIITGETLEHLTALANATGLEEQRDAMFSGAPINTTEGRSVLHTALRGDVPSDLQINGENVADFVTALHVDMRAISDGIRGNSDITDVIHIGVGGSYVGPHLVCDALRAMQDGPRLHFLSNIDGQTIGQLLASLQAEHTVVLIASKTFATLETLANADVVKQWLTDTVGAEKACQHLFAMSAATQTAHDYGVPVDHILPMRSWIGGRFSLWSSIGLPIAIAFGFDRFQELLDGAAQMDQHFKTAPLDKNIPALMGLIGIWYRNFLEFSSHAVLPYADSLNMLAVYVQQVDMESNGKAAKHKTGPVVFGAPGTGAQHAFMQSLHQGSDIIPCDFVIPAHNPYTDERLQKRLVGNALAQAQALMLGRDNADEPHRHFGGNRPSNSLVIDSLTPTSLGMLLALYEHKVFVQGAVWGINSFDQYGVELGKVLAKDIIDDLHAGTASPLHDSSTAGLIRAIVG